MSLKRSELRCYLVVLKSIQRDRSGCLVSFRQAARRARISPKSAQKALGFLGRGGWLTRRDSHAKSNGIEAAYPPEKHRMYKQRRNMR